MKYHFTPIKFLKIKICGMLSVNGMWNNGKVRHSWWGCKLVQLLQEQFPTPYDSAIPILTICPSQTPLCTRGHVTRTFIPVLFITVRMSLGRKISKLIVL